MAKIPEKSKFKQQAESLEGSLDGSLEEFAEQLQIAANQYVIQVRLLLDAAYSNREEIPAFAETVELATQLSDALLDSGFDEIAEFLEEEIADYQELAIRDFEKAYSLKPFTLNAIDVNTLQGLREFNSKQFLNLADERLVAPIRNAMIQTTASTASPSVVREAIEAAMQEALNKGEPILTRAGIEFTDHQMETLARDSFRRNYRSTKTLQAENVGFDIVWFQGPNDDITSDQCKALLTSGKHGVPNMYLKSEFNMSIHKALREPPLYAGGHFGCRHTVDLISLELAESLGWKGPKVGSIVELVDQEQQQSG